MLRGAPPRAVTFHAAAEAAVVGATPHRQNAFKVELAKRTVVRVLTTLEEVTL
jgi:xanthine dehydrogenase YagS FAD-binding subunit